MRDDGTVLVADSGNHALRQVTQLGAVTTLAGGPNFDNVTLDGAASSVCLYYVRSVVIGPSGVAYMGTDNIRMLRKDGKIGSYAGSHTSSHVDGPHAEAAFTNIQGMAFGTNNVLYVADGTRLRAVTPNKYAPLP
jgi:hypothetical protein